MQVSVEHKQMWSFRQWTQLIEGRGKKISHKIINVTSPANVGQVHCGCFADQQGQSGTLRPSSASRRETAWLLVENTPLAHHPTSVLACLTLSLWWLPRSEVSSSCSPGVGKSCPAMPGLILDTLWWTSTNFLVILCCGDCGPVCLPDSPFLWCCIGPTSGFVAAVALIVSLNIWASGETWRGEVSIGNCQRWGSICGALEATWVKNLQVAQLWVYFFPLLLFLLFFSPATVLLRPLQRRKKPQICP